MASLLRAPLAVVEAFALKSLIDAFSGIFLCRWSSHAAGSLHGSYSGVAVRRAGFVALLAVLASSIGGCEPATCFTVEECCSSRVKCMEYCVSCVEGAMSIPDETYDYPDLKYQSTANCKTPFKVCSEMSGN